MRIPVTEATTQLPELMRRAEAGDEVILTAEGDAAVRLVPIRLASNESDRRALLTAIRESAAGRANEGPSAARSQDFLYGADGLPE